MLTIMGFTGWSETAVLALYGVLGLLLCFFGHKLVPVWIGLVGFVAGGIIGWYILRLTGLEDMLWRLVIMAALAILLCVLCLKVFKAGVFILAAYCTYMLALVVLNDAAPVSELDPRYLALASAVIVGVLAIVFLKTIITVITSLGGGMMAGYGIMCLAAVSQRAAYLILGATFAVFGLIIQFGVARPRRRH